jgi:hypothetical protein
MSHSGTRNLCDMAPSRFKRFERDGYITLDADWIIPALCCAVQVEGPILEPCAPMARELRAQGFAVRGSDLYAYADTLVPDIKSGANIFVSLRRYQPPLPRTGRHPLPSSADRGPRWSPRGGPGAFRVELGRGPPRAHSPERAVRW